MEAQFSRGRARLAIAAVGSAIGATGLTGGFVWDDIAIVRQQASVPNALTLAFQRPFFWLADPDIASYYRPLVSAALAVQYKLFGGAPLGFHIVSLLLHVACAWLVFSWLEGRIADAPAGSRATESTHTGMLAALLGTLLFVCHPSRPQVVSWVSGSTDLWSGVFALAAMVLHQRARPGLPNALLTALCTALAVASKEPALVLPVAMGLDTLLCGTGPERRARWRAVAFSVVSCALVLFARSQVVSTPLSRIASFGMRSLLLRTLFSLGWSTAAVFVPNNPRIQRDADLAWFDAMRPDMLRCAGLGAAVLCVFAALLLASRTHARWRPYAADLGWYVVLLAPSLNIVPIGASTTCSERFLYLPIVGLIASFTRVLCTAPARARMALVMASALSIMGMALLSVRETRIFADERTLQEHFFQQSPNELPTINRLLTVYMTSGETGRARWMNAHRWQVTDSLAPRTGPDRALALTNYASTEALLVPPEDQARFAELRDFFDAVWSGQGSARLRVGSADRVVAVTPEVLARIRANDPGVSDAEDARIMTHAATGDFAGAEAAAQSLVGGPHPTTEARTLLARVIAWQGRFDEAARLWPREQANDVALMRVQAAIAELQTARGYGPRSALAAEAVAVAELGLPARSWALLAPLRKEGPYRPALVEALVRIQLAARRPKQAAELLSSAAQRDPRNAPRYLALLAQLTAS